VVVQHQRWQLDYVVVAPALRAVLWSAQYSDATPLQCCEVGSPVSPAPVQRLTKHHTVSTIIQLNTLKTLWIREDTVKFPDIFEHSQDTVKFLDIFEHSQDTVKFHDISLTVAALPRMLSATLVTAWCMYYSVICSGYKITADKYNY